MSTGALILLSVLANAAPASVGDQKLARSPCLLEYQPAARMARFAAKVRYLVETGASGSAMSVAEDPHSIAPPPFRPVFEAVERCIKSWTFEPARKYVLELQWGSLDMPEAWRVCPEGQACVPIPLRR